MCFPANCTQIDGLSGMGGTAGWLISSSKQVLNLWAANAGGRRGGDASLLVSALCSQVLPCTQPVQSQCAGQACTAYLVTVPHRDACQPLQHMLCASIPLGRIRLCGCCSRMHGHFHSLLHDFPQNHMSSHSAVCPLSVPACCSSRTARPLT
jgi:hypothetical protein